MFQGMICACKVPQFQLFTKVLKIGFFKLSKAPVKIHLLAVSLCFLVVNEMPNITAKDNFDTFNCLSFRAI